MNQTEHNDRRGHYRLRYPLSEQPTIRIDERDLKVWDLSEGGAKIALPGGYQPSRGQSFVGILQFTDGQTVTVEGIVLRFDQRWLVVRFTKGVSQKRMLEEQLRLRDRYPLLFDHPE